MLPCRFFALLPSYTATIHSKHFLNGTVLEFNLVSDPLVITGIFMLGASAGALVTYAKQRKAIGECRKALGLATTALRAPTEQSANLENGFAVAQRSQLGMRAFIVGRDAEMLSVFSTLLREKGIQTEKCFHELTAIEQLSSKKFEIVVLDFDVARQSANILRNLPSPNKNAVIIAVASDEGNLRRATQLGAGLVVSRPLDPCKIREFLRGSYGRMLRDSQTYFRFAVQLPVSVRRSSGLIIGCTTLNVSQTGIAVITPSTFSAGEEVKITFAIPGTDALLCAEGNVIWDDKHGKAGIHFRCDNEVVQTRYFAWLHDQFFVARESEQATANEELVYAG